MKFYHAMMLVTGLFWLTGCDRARTQQEADITNNIPRADAIVTSNAVLVPDAKPAFTNRSLLTNNPAQP